MVKVSRSFNLCTFCLNPLVFSRITLFALFPSLATCGLVSRPFRLKWEFFHRRQHLFLFFASTRPFEVRGERNNSGLGNKMADIKVYCCLTLMVFSKSNACLGCSFDWNDSRVSNKMEIQKKMFTNLNSGFGQVDFKCYFFTHKNIWISSFAEQRLENVELGSGECRPLSSLLSWVNACKR